jgi:hypothetical protein
MIAGLDWGQRAAGLRRRCIWHDAKKVAAESYTAIREQAFGTVEKVSAAESYRRWAAAASSSRRMRRGGVTMSHNDSHTAVTDIQAEALPEGLSLPVLFFVHLKVNRSRF